MKTSDETSNPRRILIVDKQPLIRRGLSALIDTAPDLIVCAAVATLHEGFEAIAECKPDLLITELLIESTDTINLVRDIRSHYPHLPLLVFSSQPKGHVLQQVLNAGASRYLNKQESDETLLFAIRQALGGGDV